jgi:uncharacterized protein (UPF0335 family)
MDNKALDEDVPRVNGTMCRFKSIKLKTNATSVKTKLFHGRKVTTVNARDIEYMECEVIDNSSHIKDMSRRLQHLNKEKKKHKQEIKQLKQQIKTARKNKTFQLKTITGSTTVRCSINPATPLLKFKTIMTQFPINLTEAVSGHKLQGRTLDKMIVTGWGLSCMKNWEYTVLSRVKTREGLFLLTPLDPNKRYGPTEQFRTFIERLKRIEARTLHTQQ